MITNLNNLADTSTHNKPLEKVEFASRLPLATHIKKELVSLLKKKKWIRSIHVVGSYVNESYIKGLASDIDVIIFVEGPYTGAMRDEITNCLETISRHHIDNINVCYSMQMGPQRIFTPGCATLLVHALVYTLAEYHKQSKIVRSSWQSNNETLYGQQADLSLPFVKLTQDDIVSCPFGMKDLLRGVLKETLPFCVWIEERGTLKKTIRYMQPDSNDRFQRQEFILYSGYHFILNCGRLIRSDCNVPNVLIDTVSDRLSITLHVKVKQIISWKNLSVKSGALLTNDDIENVKRTISDVATEISQRFQISLL